MTPSRQSRFALWVSVATTLGVFGSMACAGTRPQLSRTNLLEFVTASGEISPVASITDWEQRRSRILRAMEKVMGPLPGAEKRCPLDMQVLEQVDCGSYIRQFLSYRAEPGSRVPAYLLIPKDALAAGHRAPAMLCLHQTHPLGQKVVVGLGSSPDDEYAVELAERGFVCLAPAYPLLANYSPDLKALGYQSGTMKAIWDNIRGVDLLNSLPFVRPDGIGAIGHSLGGHNAIFTAVFEPRICAVVTSCGFDSFRDYMGGNIKRWTSPRYMPMLLSYSPDELPFDFPELIGALAPRLCVINAPFGDSNFHWWSVENVVAAAGPVYALYRTPQQLYVTHPASAHRFPPEIRELAYLFLEDQLR